MSEPHDAEFAGFERPDQNWFKLPKSWASITRAVTSIAELKVVEYVLQHTWAGHEHGDDRRISISEFRFGIRGQDGGRLDAGTGLSKQSVITGLKKAVKRGLLIETVDARDRARVRKSYRLRMKDEQGTSIEHSMEPIRQPLDADVQVLDRVHDLDTGGLSFGHRSESNGNGNVNVNSPVTVQSSRQTSQRHSTTAGEYASQIAAMATGPAGDDSPLQSLPDNGLSDGERKYLTEFMLERFGDVNNKAYYILVARKMNQQHIMTNMAEIAQDTKVQHPERVFAARMTHLANERCRQLASQPKREMLEKARRKQTIGSL